MVGQTYIVACLTCYAMAICFRHHDGNLYAGWGGGGEKNSRLQGPELYFSGFSESMEMAFESARLNASGWSIIRKWSALGSTIAW